MSDIGDIFKALREYNQEKKQRNQENSERLLKEKGIEFIKFTSYHLRLKNYPFDFYPSTGLYINRNTKQSKRGVFNLLKDIKNG